MIVIFIETCWDRDFGEHSGSTPISTVSQTDPWRVLASIAFATEQPWALTFCQWDMENGRDYSFFPLESQCLSRVPKRIQFSSAID